MGVLIRGMEMPKDVTLLAISSDGTVDIVHGEGNLTWLKDKAISVPPHGRLIDADALEDELVQFCDDNWAYNTLRHAPTIIEAEEGE